MQKAIAMTQTNSTKPRRSVGIISICAIAPLCLCGCSAILDSIFDGERDRRAEKQYIRHGDTPKEAKQKVFEDKFFRDVGGRP